MKKFRAEFIFVSKWMACSLSQKSCHCSNTMVYLTLVNFLQRDKGIYCDALETFCDSIILRICELTEASTWDIEEWCVFGSVGRYRFFAEAIIINGWSTSIRKSTGNQFCIVQEATTLIVCLVAFYAGP